MANCKSCGAAITWAKSATGKAMPMQADPNGAWVIVDGIAQRRGERDQRPRFVSHFSTCPQADNWRNRK